VRHQSRSREKALSIFKRPAVVTLATLALQACSNNPTVSSGGAIEDFARNLNGKQFSFDLRGVRFRSEDSAAPVGAERIPKGLAIGLAPALDHCKRAGGEPSLADVFEAAPDGSVKVNLPRRVLCLRSGNPVWVLDVRYADVRVVSGIEEALRTPIWDLRMKLQTQLLSADQYAARLKEEQAQAQSREKAAAAQKERQAAIEQERQQRARAQEAEARKLVAEWPARVAAFQANLKVGDRVKWGQPLRFYDPCVGLVVRIEGGVAFIQFDNLTVGGQPTRYIPKIELGPCDSPPPQR
jgi:biotin carboxyl carrier protein